MAGASLAVARAAFEAQHSSELSVAEGERLWVLAEQPEAASRGWRAVVKYSEPNSKPGLVPADYLEHGWYGEALADFAAEADVEMTIVTGQRMWLLPLDQSAEAEGWFEGVAEDGSAGLVPQSYVRIVPGMASQDAPDAPAAAQDPAYDEALEGGEALEQERSALSESGRTPAESVSGWLAEAMVVLADADEGAALEAEALADFEPEADVELRLVAGERVALLIGCTPPSGWSVALRRSEVSGGGPTKGLVPATYVQLLPFEAIVVVAHPAADAQQLGVARDERVTVQPARSTASCWWVQRQGEDGQASGEEGLVSRSHLKPLSAEDLQQQLRKEADALRQQVEREAAKREAEASKLRARRDRERQERGERERAAAAAAAAAAEKEKEREKAKAKETEEAAAARRRAGEAGAAGARAATGGAGEGAAAQIEISGDLELEAELEAMARVEAAERAAADAARGREAAVRAEAEAAAAAREGEARAEAARRVEEEAAAAAAKAGGEAYERRQRQEERERQRERERGEEARAEEEAAKERAAREAEARGRREEEERAREAEARRLAEARAAEAEARRREAADAELTASVELAAEERRRRQEDDARLRQRLKEEREAREREEAEAEAAAEAAAEAERQARVAAAAEAKAAELERREKAAAERREAAIAAAIAVPPPQVLAAMAAVESPSVARSQSGSELAYEEELFEAEAPEEEPTEGDAHSRSLSPPHRAAVQLPPSSPTPAPARGGDSQRTARRHGARLPLHTPGHGEMGPPGYGEFGYASADPPETAHEIRLRVRGQMPTHQPARAGARPASGPARRPTSAAPPATRRPASAAPRTISPRSCQWADHPDLEGQLEIYQAELALSEHELRVEAAAKAHAASARQQRPRSAAPDPSGGRSARREGGDGPYGTTLRREGLARHNVDTPGASWRPRGAELPAGPSPWQGFAMYEAGLTGTFAIPPPLEQSEVPLHYRPYLEPPRSSARRPKSAGARARAPLVKDSRWAGRREGATGLLTPAKGGMYGGARGGTHTGNHGGVPQRQLWVLRSLYGQTLREQPPAAPPHTAGLRRRKAAPHHIF